MTALEYYAAHAPDVPAWYVPPAPTTPRPKMPRPEDWPRIAHAIIREWLADQCFELPPEAAGFAEAHRAAFEAIAAWERTRAEEIFFAWRWYYAGRMNAESAALRGWTAPGPEFTK